MSIYVDALSEFRERFADVLDTDDRLKDGADVPTDWEGYILEMADSLVPVYNSDRIREWTEDGYPDPDDDFGSTDILQLIGYALYSRYCEELYKLAEEAGFNA